MHPRGSSLGARRLGRIRISVGVAFAGLLALVAGCDHASSPGSAGNVRVTKCGTGKTAAGVPVKVEVTRGSTTCTTALAIEKAYADAIRSGRAPGNGGRGPVKVNGWTCHGFATPKGLKTGFASECDLGGSTILAILMLPQSPSS